MKLPPLPGGLLTRISLVLLAALLIEFAGNVLIGVWQERQLVTAEQTRQIAQQLRVAQRMALAHPRRERTRLMSELSGPALEINWGARTVITDYAGGHSQLARMRRDLIAAAPELADRDLRLSLIPSDHIGRRDLLGAVRLDNDGFLTFRVRSFLGSGPSLAARMALHILLIAAVLGIAFLSMRAIIQPLAELARAADATGRGVAPTVKAQGPREVRQVAIAFAAMQTRLLKMIEDHTGALLAVSHDLRTPVQRLRLRASLLGDEEIREAMTADLLDIERFIGSVVGYMRGEEEESPRLVDVAALAMTAVDNAADTGADIDYRGPDELIAVTRPLALKRALGNLVENAIRNAAHVIVALETDGVTVSLAVEDDGPGIPPDKYEEVFMPFRRLDSLAHSSGGAGLGLAIVRGAVAALPGDVTLGAAAMGGLSATIRFASLDHAARR